MKVNELARLTGLNAETIRKYRDRGLLRPKCLPDNGYYEYSYADFLNLLYIRKLRGAHLSLDAIEATYSGEDAGSLLKGYHETIEALDEQIRLLMRRKRMLMLSYRHYERDAVADREVRLIESFGDKYDSYFEVGCMDPVLKQWVENVDLFTLVLGIRQRWFEEKELPEHVPVRIGLGTYGTILRENDFPVPENCHVFPQGEYASFFLELEELDSISSEALCPVRDFLTRENLRADSDTTAYLYRVDNRDGQIRFIFCTRVKVVKNT